MDIRRLSLALFVALLLSAGATYYTYTKIRSLRTSAPSTIRMVTAAGPLKAGTALTQERLKLVDWPANLAVADGVTKLEDAVGRSLIYPVNENQPILTSYLAEAGSGIGLSVKIPDGMRATSIRSNDVVGVAGFLYPGSHVDVVLTYKPDNAANTNPVTQTILQNVTVLTAGQTIEPDPKGKPEPVNVVTLLLNPHDSEKLVLASQQGTVQFVLRNGADQDKVATRPAEMSEMNTGEKPVGKTDIVRVRATVPKKAPEVYTVETIAGDKHTIDKF